LTIFITCETIFDYSHSYLREKSEEKEMKKKEKSGKKKRWIKRKSEDLI